MTATVTPEHTTGDITHDTYGWFYRYDGTNLRCLSDSLTGSDTPPTGPLTLLVRDGAPVPGGDRLATRVALTLDKRFRGTS